MSISKRVKFVPVFDGGVKGWTINYLTKNAWRVERIMTFDDCMQEANLVFLRVKRAYPRVTEPQHFMALFKTSWTNRFNDLSEENTKIRNNEVLLSLKGAVMPVEDNRVGDMANEGELLVMLRQAPREVRMVLDLMLRAPQEIVDLVFTGWRKDKQRGSSRINKLLGFPPEQETLQHVEDYFRQ